jgi:hypothetical protein
MDLSIAYEFFFFEISISVSTKDEAANEPSRLSTQPPPRNAASPNLASVLVPTVATSQPLHLLKETASKDVPSSFLHQLSGHVDCPAPAARRLSTQGKKTYFIEHIPKIYKSQK